MRLLNEDKRLCTFYALFAGFGLTTLIGPLMNSVGIYWIAIELTTLVSTFLIAFERVAESMEAAWKYIMVVSAESAWHCSERSFFTGAAALCSGQATR